MVAMTDTPQVELDALPQDAALLDVREQDEWDSGHAEGATHIPLSEIPQRLHDLPEADEIYVVCRSGGRSLQATKWLNAQGISAINVAGGMKRWQAAGRPIVAADGEPFIV